MMESEIRCVSVTYYLGMELFSPKFFDVWGSFINHVDKAGGGVFPNGSRRERGSKKS